MDQILDKKPELEELAKQFGLVFVGLYGSRARGDYQSDSDVDLLVEYKQPISLFEHVRLERLLSNLFDAKVEATTKKALNKHLKPYIEKDVQVIYEAN